MADVAAPASASPAAATSAKKTKTSGGVKKAKTVIKPTHPITSIMVNKAIADLKEKGGSSLQAIKKYISANYKVDADKLAPFIRKYLKNAVESGALVRTKGKGAAGSFKLDVKPAKGEKKPAAKKSPAKPNVGKGVQKKKVSAPATKKAVAKPKKATAPKKVVPAAKKAAAKPKSPPKAKKSVKPPTRKPKSPKPKKAVSTKSKAIKRTAGKK